MNLKKQQERVTHIVAKATAELNDEVAKELKQETEDKDWKNLTEHIIATVKQEINEEE
jgi:hypothetical protein